MKSLKYYVLLFFLLGVFSCAKKKYPESISENTPVFYTQMTVDGTPVVLDAGINNYRTFSSYFQDTTKLYSFVSELKPTDCVAACANSFKIKINDFKTLPLNASVNIDSALRVNSYSYQTPKNEMQFQSQYNKTAASYFWDFGDGTFSNLSNPIHNYTKAGNYIVSLKITGTNGCESSLTNIIKVGKANACQAIVSAAVGSGNIISFSQNTSGVAPFKYAWSFGDGTTSALANPSHNYIIKGSYPVKLIVIDANNDTAIVNYNVVTPGDASSCATNFIADNNSGLGLPFSQVTIDWVDASGTKYTSNNSLQPNSSNFQIISVEDYDNNENNQRTKKLHIKFNCKVYSGSGIVNIENGEAVICVAYK